MAIGFGVLFVIGLIRAVVAPPDKPKPTPTPVVTPTPKGDASAQAACQHFRNVKNDYAQQTLTKAEMRAKFKEVDSSAKVSDFAPVKAASTALLAASTAGKDPINEIGQMMAACEEAGYPATG